MGVMRTLLFRDSTPCRPEGSPFCTILRYPFLMTDPKIFYGRLRRQYILIFRGERAQKKTALFWQFFFKKCLKTPLFGLFFFKILLAAQKFRPKQGLFGGLGELRKSFWSTYKKSRQNFRKLFENPPPTLEKILDPPLAYILFFIYSSRELRLNFFCFFLLSKNRTIGIVKDHTSIREF